MAPSRTPGSSPVPAPGDLLAHPRPSLAIDVATGNWDDYGYNKNNYFLYHHLTTGQFEFVTYDTDNTFGVDWVQRDWATRDCRDWLTHSEPRPLASKLLAVPALETYYYHVLDSVTQLVTRPDSIFPRIDYLKNLITAAALADTFRSLDYGYDFADFELGYTGTVDGHTPYGIKPFLATRYQNTLSQLATVDSYPPQELAASVVAFPNPVGDGEMLHLRAAALPTQTLSVSLWDVTGRNLGQWKWQAFEQFLEVDTGGLPQGHYLLRLQGKGVEASLRIMHD